MAKSGTKAAVGRPAAAGAQETRDALVRGAIEALKEEGFAGASAREIARRAGLQPGPRLLPLRLGDQPAAGSARRGQRDAPRRTTRPPSTGRTGLGELVDAAEAVFEEDLDAGHIAVLAEMIAGASATPGLAPEVAARIAPWRQFAADALRGVLSGTPLWRPWSSPTSRPTRSSRSTSGSRCWRTRRGPHGRSGAVRPGPAAGRARRGVEWPSRRRAGRKGEAMTDATDARGIRTERGSTGLSRPGIRRRHGGVQLLGRRDRPRARTCRAGGCAR